MANALARADRLEAALRGLRLGVMGISFPYRGDPDWMPNHEVLFVAMEAARAALEEKT